MLGCFVINLLNNKTIILLNLAEYHLILADDRPRRLSIRRYSARFCRIIFIVIINNCKQRFHIRSCHIFSLLKRQLE